MPGKHFDLDISTSLGGELAAHYYIPSQKAVKTYVDTLDANVLHLTGSETITGDKSFNGQITASTPVANDVSNKVATTEFVHNAVSKIIFRDWSQTDAQT